MVAFKKFSSFLLISILAILTVLVFMPIGSQAESTSINNNFEIANENIFKRQQSISSQRANLTGTGSTSSSRPKQNSGIIVGGSTAGIFFGVGFAVAFFVTGVAIFVSRDVAGTYRIVGLAPADYYGNNNNNSNSISAIKINETPRTSVTSRPPLPQPPISSPSITHLPYPGAATMPPRVDSRMNV